ncbi:t box transcription factor tbx2 [Echinococcus multilocularis]|uniref:T box transcription factor tbx2 n=1 Tax=Echinococcus multilocularis TaxID=6211 RepID=A0A068XTW0_ECHMU|nr:t box transcription factor tbx2 [Echinococcus multilocularis]
MKDAIHIADEVLRQVSHSYAFERWAGEFPSAEFHLPKGNLKIELMSDYANIRVSVNGTYEDFPIGNLDIDDIKRKILTITSR